MTTPGGDPEAHSQRIAERPRDSRGKIIRSIATAQRDAEACDLRAQGWTYRRIADHFGIDVHTAYDAVQNTLKATIQEPADTLRTLMRERLDAERVRLAELEEAVRAVLEREHVTVSNGQVVRLDGHPIPDDAPILQAADRLMRIDEQRRKADESERKLLGLDAPSRVSVEAEQLGRQIARLLDEALAPEDTSDDPDA